MQLLYIAAPYRAKTICSLQQNIADAKLMAMYYWHKGYAVICPHLNSANFDGLCDDKIFLSGTMTMLSKCDAIAMHPNWKQSTGCVAEYNYMLNKQTQLIMDCSKKKIKIFYPEWDEILTIQDVIYKEG